MKQKTHTSIIIGLRTVFHSCERVGRFIFLVAQNLGFGATFSHMNMHHDKYQRVDQARRKTLKAIAGLETRWNAVEATKYYTNVLPIIQRRPIAAAIVQRVRT
jgi:hypothetical protein